MELDPIVPLQSDRFVAVLRWAKAELALDFEICGTRSEPIVRAGQETLLAVPTGATAVSSLRFPLFFSPPFPGNLIALSWVRRYWQEHSISNSSLFAMRMGSLQYPRRLRSDAICAPWHRAHYCALNVIVSQQHARLTAAGQTVVQATIATSPELLQRIANGDFTYVFASPEALLSTDRLRKRWRQILNAWDHHLLPIVVDEAHLQSYWGARFRPEYAELGKRCNWDGAWQHNSRCVPRPATCVRVLRCG